MMMHLGVHPEQTQDDRLANFIVDNKNKYLN